MVTRGALLALAAVTTTLFVFDLWATSVIDARSSNVVQGASFDGGRARLQRDAVIRQDGNSGMRGQQISATRPFWCIVTAYLNDSFASESFTSSPFIKENPHETAFETSVPRLSLVSLIRSAG